MDTTPYGLSVPMYPGGVPFDASTLNQLPAYNTDPYSYNSAYGGIPNLPPYLRDTTSQVGTDVQGQMIQNLPGYLVMSAQDSANIQANLAGQINPDVMALMQQQAAERGISTGSPLSPNSSAAYLRALGLTSQGLQQLGSQQLTSAIQRTPIQQTQQGSQTTDLAALIAQNKAAPVPSSAAAANRNALNQGLNSGNQAGGGKNYWQQQADFMAQMQQLYGGGSSVPGGLGTPAANPYAPHDPNSGLAPGTGNANFSTDQWWDPGYYDPEGLLSGGGSSDYYDPSMEFSPDTGGYYDYSGGYEDTGGYYDYYGGYE